MKKCYMLMIFIIVTITLAAQNIGIGTTTPNASAMLEIKASDKGLLIPRTSTTSRTAIVNPAKGLMIYDSTTSSFWFHDGATWVQIGLGVNGWSLTGNAGTNSIIDFIGTTDAQPLVFKVNNTIGGYLDYDAAKGNTSFGYLGLSSNTSGSANTANGMYALYLNETGSQNTATGFASLYSNTSGNFNSGHGAGALNYNTSGLWNTASGAYAMYYNSQGNYNTATGGYALQNNLSGNNNTANGYNALSSNTTGNNNTASGVAALYYTTTGENNTANGLEALHFNTTGNENTAIGADAMLNNTTGSLNTATGISALEENTSGGANTATGVYALNNNTTGRNNTATGHGALSINSTGNANTALGWNADVESGNLSNSTAIGFIATVDASNKVRIGNTTITSIGGQVGWSIFSDGRYKKNIKEDVKGLSFIMSLRPISYTVDINSLNEYYDKGRIHDSNYEKMKKDMQPSADEAATIVYNGFIAQEVEKTAQSLGYKFNGVDKPKTKDGLYGLRYSEFVVPLVKAVQEQQQLIDDLKKQITAQEKINASLIARLTMLESALTTKK